MLYLNFLKKNDSIVWLSSIIIFFSIFLWDLKFHIFQAKFLISILILYNIILFEKKDLKFYFYFLVFVSLLALHLFVLDSLILKDKYIIFSLIFFFINLIVLYKIHIYFSEILDKSVKIFLLFVNIIFFFELILLDFSLYDHANLINGLCTLYHKEEYFLYSNFFSENSHLGMMSPAIILYSFMNFVEKNNYEKINILIFTFISLLFFLSLTLILGLIFGLLVIFIFGLLKKNNSKIFVIMPVVLSLIILLSIQNCWGRLYQTLNLNILYDKIPENSNIIKISKKLNALKLYLVQDKEFKTSEEIKKSLGTIRKLQDNIDILEVNLSKTMVEVKFNILKDMLITIDNEKIKKLIYEIENLKMEIEKKDLSTTTKFVMENEKIKKIHIKIDQKIKMILDYVNNEIESEIIYSIDKISKNKQIENIKANILENKKLIKTLQNDYGKRDRFFLDETINVSTIVHLNHYMIAFDSIRSNFLGWGFQNYKSAAIQHAKNAKMIETYSDEIFLNINDGSNNFNKLIVEFGYLNLIFIFMFFIFVFKSNLDKRTKVFIFVILVTQLLRGAGYFNGGFLFVTVSGMLSIFINQQKLKNEKN